MNCARLALALALLPACAGQAGAVWLFGKQSNPELDKAMESYDRARYDEAAQSFEELINKGLPTDDREQAYLYMGKAWRKAGKPDKALPVLQLGVELYPDNLGMQLALAGLYYDSALYSQAKKLYEQIAAIDDLDDHAKLPLYTGLARTYAAMGYLNHASEYYKQALELQPRFDPKLNLEYGLSLLQRRKYADAAAAADKALEQAPSNTDLLLLSAKTSYESGRKEKALVTMRHALALEPWRDDIRLTYSLWLSSTGRYGEAATEATRVCDSHKDNAQAQLALALALLHLPGERQTAVDLLAKASNSITSPFTAATAHRLLDALRAKP